MTDLKVLLELLLLIAAPVMPVVAGIMLRRRFPLPPPGTRPTPGTRAGRLIGGVLFWCGIMAITMVLVFILNYKGVI